MNIVGQYTEQQHVRHLEQRIAALHHELALATAALSRKDVELRPLEDNLAGTEVWFKQRERDLRERFHLETAALRQQIDAMVKLGANFLAHASHPMIIISTSKPGDPDA